jgi:SAM-dependent methyltransferase
LPDAWPGELRRRAPRTSPTYAVRAPLARWLRGEAERIAAAGETPRILDVGCGVKPYYPFFRAQATAYVGLDMAANPSADVVGVVEALPLEDASFDVVLCNQVLEHCDDPAQAVRELRRVTAPGGRVLASTHGTQVYHPSPHDLWRWTHAGLERLFAQNADWGALRVSPGSGTTACIGMLVATYLDLVAQRAHVRRLGYPVVAAINAVSEAIDNRVPTLREPVAGSLIANFHVTAEVAA